MIGVLSQLGVVGAVEAKLQVWVKSSFLGQTINPTNPDFEWKICV